MITETAKIMIQQSVLLELDKHKTKLTIAQEEEKPDPSKVKSPLKGKSTFTNFSSKENDKRERS